MKLLTTFLLGLFSIFESSGQHTERKAILTGVIENYDSSISLSVKVNRIGLSSSFIKPNIDPEGNFYVELGLYIPTEIIVMYRSNFPVILFPNDSLHIRFTGNSNNRHGILSSLRFSGANATTNEVINNFIINDKISGTISDKNTIASKKYEPLAFKRYNDSLAGAIRVQLDELVEIENLNDFEKRWIRMLSSEELINNLNFYGKDHRDLNGYKIHDRPIVFPVDYFEQLDKFLPLDISNLFNSQSMLSYLHAYTNRLNEQLKLTRKEEDPWFVDGFGLLHAQSEFMDSIELSKITNFTRDPLLKEILISAHISKTFAGQNIKFYENNRSLIDNNLTYPFLKQPLHQEYLRTKQRIENPQFHTEAVLEDVSGSAVKDIIGKIFEENKGKVIYVDFWATWCGPCIGAFPRSKELEMKNKEKDVSFVYLCLGSDIEQFKAHVSEHQLGGQHYFLSNKQASEIYSIFEIQGIPYYMLVDKEGKIVEKGNHIGPMTVEGKINSLLKSF